MTTGRHLHQHTPQSYKSSIRCCPADAVTYPPPASSISEPIWLQLPPEPTQLCVVGLFGISSTSVSSRNSKKAMKQSKDPFEAAYEEQEETPPNSPVGTDDLDTHTPAASQDPATLPEDDDIGITDVHPTDPSTSAPTLAGVRSKSKSKEDDDEEEEENVDVELAKFPSTADPDKMAKMQAILSQFTEDQMSRYESFRRSALQKANMRRLLVSITGTQKISLPMTIVVCGIAKMFVGELVETARIVMAERNESGPIRPCHIREAYRRLKLEGKVPKRSVPRLFR